VVIRKKKNFTRAQIKQKKFQGRKPEMGYITRAKNTINPKKI